MTEKIEYRVRMVPRYIVTRYHAPGGGSEFKGEFGSYEAAYAVAYALCKDEHQRLEWPLDDERIQYPQPDDEHMPAMGMGQVFP